MSRTRAPGAPTFVRGFVVLFAGSLVGKVAGLVREVVFAAAFGSGLVATGFKSAQSAVLVSANLVTGDLLSSAFVPTYARLRVDDPRRAADLLWAYLVAYGTVMSGIAALVFAFRHPAMDAVIPGAAAPVRLLAGDFLGTLAWCIPLFGVASIAGYALATHGAYTATSLRATLQTAGLLVGTLAAVLLGAPAWLAAGFVVAWTVYTAWCLTLLVRLGLLGSLRARALAQALRVVGGNLVSVLPLAVIPIGVQIAIVGQRVIASHGPAALIASTDYAQTLSDSLVTLVSVPLGFVGLTQLSTLSEARFLASVRRMLAFVLAIGLPLTFVVLPLTGVIVTAVFRRGTFGAEAAALTTQVAFGMFCGLSVQILGYALTRALTARRRNRAALWVSLSALGAQLGTQFLSLPLHAPVFLGLGLSVYGAVLTVLSVRLLGLGRQFARLALGALPAGVVSIGVLVVPGVPLAFELAVIVVAWAAVLGVDPRYRAVLVEGKGLLRARRQAGTEEPIAALAGGR